jgi:hypothetical protein
VDGTDHLDSNLDWNTFRFTDVGFGDTVIAAPAGRQHYTTTVDMTYNGVSFEVEIILDLDATTGQLQATFLSLDSTTGLPPSVLIGSLPPEGGTGRGTGYLSYLVSLKNGLATGTQIRNVTRVTFDLGESIDTDQVDEHDPGKGHDPDKQDLVTIDAGAPTSSVSLLSAVTTSTSFTVSWSGTDDAGGSLVAYYDVYVSDNGGAFAPLLTHATLTSAAFTGVNGHTYSFSGIATDNVGNREASKTAAEATTLVSQGTSVAVDSVVSTDGSAQRSGVNSITVMLNTVVTLDDGAIEVDRAKAGRRGWSSPRRRWTAGRWSSSRSAGPTSPAARCRTATTSWWGTPAWSTTTAGIPRARTARPRFSGCPATATATAT